MTDSPVLELRELSLGYGEPRLVLKNSPSVFQADASLDSFVVKKVDLALSSGDFLLIQGRNGSGKTTLLRGLLGLVPQVRGSLLWGVARSEIGYVPQDAAIEADSPATALDVVRAADPAGWSRNRQAAADQLERVGMRSEIGRRFSQLSGGQKRRVLMARALLGWPKVLLLDEPTANVDETTEAEMENWVNEIRERNHTAVIAISHSAHWAPSARKLQMTQGRLSSGATPKDGG